MSSARTSAAALLLLLVPLGASAVLDLGDAAPPPPSECTLVGSSDFSTNPIGSGWTVVNEDIDCPVTWDAGTGTIRRTSEAPGLCSNTTAYLMFDTPATQDGCFRYQIVESEDGTGDTDGWEQPNVLFRLQIPVSDGYLSIACENSLNCTTLRLRINDGTGFALTSTGFHQIHELDFVGVGIQNIDTDTDLVRVFDLGPSTPPDPLDAECSGWGTPAVTFDTAPFGEFFQDRVGGLWAIGLRSNSPHGDAFVAVDNPAIYACGGEEPGNFCRMGNPMPCVMEQ